MCENSGVFIEDCKRMQSNNQDTQASLFAGSADVPSSWSLWRTGSFKACLGIPCQLARKSQKKAPDAESTASFTRVSGSCLDTATSMKSEAGNKTEQTRAWKNYRLYVRWKKSAILKNSRRAQICIEKRTGTWKRKLHLNIPLFDALGKESVNSFSVFKQESPFLQSMLCDFTKLPGPQADFYGDSKFCSQEHFYVDLLKTNRLLILQGKLHFSWEFFPWA